MLRNLHRSKQMQLCYTVTRARRLASSASASQPRLPSEPSSSQSRSTIDPPKRHEAKPFKGAPAPYKQMTPNWLLNSPVFRNVVTGFAKVLGHNTSRQTAIRETRFMYEACAEREVKEAGFIYVECRLAPTFQTWFSFTNLHVWALITRFRALPPPYGRLYIQELINHFFLDAEHRLRAVYGPRCPERIIKNQMIDLRDQWNGSNSSYDVALVKSDVELATAVWRNLFAARGEKAYKEQDLPEAERERRIADRQKKNDPEADGAPLEDIPGLLYLYAAHLRREVVRLEQVPDADVMVGALGKWGRAGALNHADTLAVDLIHPSA